MDDKFFRGYNCFSVVLGQYFLNTNLTKPIDSILIRWTFDFNMEMLLEKAWYVGACVEPADYLLQYDLYRNEGIRITSHKTSMDESAKILSDELKRVGSHIVSADFYLLKSIDWERMKRFGYFPKHLPHFIIITNETETDVTYQDPLYKFEGNISKQDLIKARGANVCNLDVAYEYFKVDDIGLDEKYTKKEKIDYQFHRFLNNGQLDKIGEFADALKIVYYYLKDIPEYDVLFDIYLALESVVIMRQNFIGILIQENIDMKKQLLSLVMNWASIRRQLLYAYKQKDISVIKDIREKLYLIKDEEEVFAKSILGKGR